MKSKKVTKTVLRVLLAVILAPIILLWVVVGLLYIPQIQQLAKERAITHLSQHSDFDLSVGNINITFPLNIKIEDFALSKESTLVTRGERLSISLQPLSILKGEIEANYILLENTTFDTGTLIEGTNIAGEIGVLRTVARGADLINHTVDIRQIHLYNGNIAISSREAEEEKESVSAPFDWTFALHKGNFENFAISFCMPKDTMHITATAGQLTLNGATADVANNSYSLKNITLTKGEATYRHGTLTREEAPLQNIVIKEINITGNNILYSTRSTQADISKFMFEQEEGIILTEGTCSICSDSTHINIKQVNLQSSNGSFIEGSAKLPLSLLHNSPDTGITTSLKSFIDKRDATAFISREQQRTLRTLPDSLLKTKIQLHGTTNHLVLDTAYISIPTITEITARGSSTNIDNPKKRKAQIEINGYISNKLISPSDTTLQRIEINGNGNIKESLCFADIKIKSDGQISLLGTYESDKKIYDILLKSDKFNLAHTLPEVPLNNISMNMTLSGMGTDIFDKNTYYQLTAKIDTLVYNNGATGNIHLNACQIDSKANIILHSNNEKSLLSLITNYDIDDTHIAGNALIDVDKLQLDSLGASEQPASCGMKIKIEGYTDLQETHRLALNADDIFINTQERDYKPAPLSVELATAPTASHARANNGDFKFSGTTDCGYKHLISQIEKIAEMLNKARTSEKLIYYATDFEQQLPEFELTLECGRDNMLHNFASMNGFEFTSLDLRCQTDTAKRVQSRGAIYNLRTADVKLDTIRLFTKQEGENIKYFAGVRSSATTAENKKQNFNATLYGNLNRDTLDTNITLTGNDKENRSYIGFNTLLCPEGLDISIKPQAKVFGNEITINSDNYIKIGKNEKIEAGVRATDNNNAGLHFYTTDDSLATQDISLEIFNIDLKTLTEKMPFAPNLAGTLYSDIHYRKEATDMMFSGDIRCDSLSYEGSYLGNEYLETTYLPRKNMSHYLSLMLHHNDEEVINISGDYYNDNNIKSEATINRLPLKLANAFMQGSNMNVDGYIDGELSLVGQLTTPTSNGYIIFDSVSIDAPLLGSRLQLHKERVNIEDSKLLFDKLKIYAKGNTPFLVNGNIDIANIANPVFNLRMQAKDYELINAPRQKNSIIYGNLTLDINSLISGPLQSLRMYGAATVLGKSNITYVMHDNGIATNNELDGLVEFVNFKDTTTVATTEETLDLGNITMAMTLNIEEGAWINADLDANRNSYINLQGGGQLNLGYTNTNGLSLTGRYTLNNGEMKYSLPIIPLKTFSIIPGSYVNWTGDIMNPTLNITALERVVAAVSLDEGKSQPVAFDVGLVLSNTLDNMELGFTLRAPENANVQDELDRLDAETLNKYAVTMLITGAYVGSSGGLTVSNALTSFLDAKINDLAGDAMKDVSINVGITDVENKDTGGSYMNYSFSFAKRFWNDRLTIVIGGEVNSGAHPDGEQSFINNVSLEWRITPEGNRYLRLFYDKNYESILEGEITETGIGYVYKRKFNNLGELLYIRRKEKR